MLEGIIFSIVLIIDQVSKHLTELYLQSGKTYPLWEGVFELANVHNTGAAWGMLAGARWFFIIVTLLSCGGMLYLLVRFRKQLGIVARICLTLLLAGAIGNLIDRIFLGYVRDMLYFSLIDFPVFNIADSAVCIGAGLLFFDTFFIKKGALLDTIEPLFEKGTHHTEKMNQHFELSDEGIEPAEDSTDKSTVESNASATSTDQI